MIRIDWVCDIHKTIGNANFNCLGCFIDKNWKNAEISITVPTKEMDLYFRKSIELLNQQERYNQ